MKFDIIASTGRTATTYIATALSALPGVAAMHEGYCGADKDADPLLPLINLQNAAAFASPRAAEQTVGDLRNRHVLEDARKASGASHLIDVAYYNATIGPEILAQHPQSRMIGIIRDCEEFVRSSTTLQGEDPLPVGWPDAAKPLSDREKFIAMGRIRPARGSAEKALWADWSAIRRNIWLWRETNLRLCQAKATFGPRVALVDFRTFQTDEHRFWDLCATFLGVPAVPQVAGNRSGKARNKKPFGYQIGPCDTWSAEEQAALSEARTTIKEAAEYDI